MKIRLFDICLRLIVWFLLTADLSLPNVAIGLGIALLLPSATKITAPLKIWLQTFWQILVMIPQAYGEAIAMMFHPHRQEEIEYDSVTQKRNVNLTFFDIFRITFTPKTIVLKHDAERGYQIHRIERRKSP